MTEARAESAAQSTNGAGPSPAGETGVPTVFFGASPILKAGFRHLLADTRFQLVEPASADDPVPGEGGLVLLAAESGDGFKTTLAAIRRLKEAHPGTRVCLLADHFEPGSVIAACRAQADGFCLTTASREVLIRSLELIMLGESFIPSTVIPGILDQLATRNPRSRTTPVQPAANPAHPLSLKLSSREGEILRSLMEGAPNKIIARQFGVTEATVKVHVKAILRKIGAKNRTQAAMWAANHNTISVEADTIGIQ